MRLGMIFLLSVLALPAMAQEWRTDPVTPLDQQYMDNAKAELNDLARINLGRSFGFSRDQDLTLIQTLLDRKLVTGKDTKNLQAMGLIMGEYLRKENGLKWVIYSDKLGRSRALEVPLKDQFVFPVTQISSRASVGAEVDVMAIYHKLEDEISRIKKMIIVR